MKSKSTPGKGCFKHTDTYTKIYVECVTSQVTKVIRDDVIVKYLWNGWVSKRRIEWNNLSFVSKIIVFYLRADGIPNSLIPDILSSV